VIERRIRPLIGESLSDTRVVMVMGARWAGKSTLCEAIDAEEQRPTVSMDDQGARERAMGLRTPKHLKELPRRESTDP
jgi:hypothetical protein